MAARPATSSLLPSVHHAAAGAADLAVAYRDIIATDPHLAGYAAGQDHHLRRISENPDTSSDKAAVDPRDLLQRRTTPLLPGLRQALHHDGAVLVAATQRAVVTSSGLPAHTFILPDDGARLRRSQQRAPLPADPRSVVARPR